MAHWLQMLVLVLPLISVGHFVSAETGQEQANQGGPLAKRLAVPHVRIGSDGKSVELDAKVIRQLTDHGEWLELLVCAPGGPDHESVLMVQARPSHIHLALLMLGLKPGSPMRWTIGETRITVEKPPTGPRVAVTAVYQRQGKTHEAPVNKWIVNQRTKRPLSDNIWLFTGSRFRQYEGKSVYMADLSGTVLSLVNFGDELLARATNLTNRSDDEAWGAAKDSIPAVGTKVTLRLTPVPPTKDKKVVGGAR